jgi:hypothetical protein
MHEMLLCVALRCVALRCVALSGTGKALAWGKGRGETSPLTHRSRFLGVGSGVQMNCGEVDTRCYVQYLATNRIQRRAIKN